jgi:hypothetical protein
MFIVNRVLFTVTGREIMIFAHPVYTEINANGIDGCPEAVPNPLRCPSDVNEAWFCQRRNRFLLCAS